MDILLIIPPKSWFDKECGCLRREVKQKLRKFRRSCLLDDRVDYILAKKHLRALYRQKKKERDKDIWDRVKKSADAKQFWTEIKKFTRRKQIVGQNIADADWNAHFMNLLGGTDAKPPWDDLGFAEFSAQIAKLKNNKSPGPDQLINEFLKALPSGPRRRLLGWINEIWRQQAWLPQRRVAGDASLPSNYRGITLLNGIYKVITAMMAKRISSWLEENHKIKESQAGFRRGYNTFYSWILNIDRTKLFEKIWKIGIRGHMFSMIKKIYEETSSCVRTAKGLTEMFWTNLGVRQGCPLSPVLFVIFLNDLEDNWIKWNMGGTLCGRWKLYCLKFSDDVAIIAESAVGLQAMISELERHVGESKLTVNVGKSKIVIFRRGGRRAKEEAWWFCGQQFEVVNSFKYLGYIFSTKNSTREHLREHSAKASKVVNKVWGIVKRAGLQDFASIERLFDSLILSVVGYGVEIWGLRLREVLERVQGKFFKMLCGLDRNTPDYIWWLEMGRPRLELLTIRRVFYFMLHILRMGDHRWPLRCLREDLLARPAGRGWWGDLSDLLRSVGLLALLKGLRKSESLELIGAYMEEVLRIKAEQDLQDCWLRIYNSAYCPYYGQIKLCVMDALDVATVQMLWIGAGDDTACPLLSSAVGHEGFGLANFISAVFKQHDIMQRLTSLHLALVLLVNVGLIDHYCPMLNELELYGCTFSETSYAECLQESMKNVSFKNLVQLSIESDEMTELQMKMIFIQCRNLNSFEIIDCDALIDNLILKLVNWKRFSACTMDWNKGRKNN
uniref:Reverse transcriptase domain-containing protein n=1 Tax=Strigamia maritima TaxID=126957 RepID=T1IHP6_STRMM